MRTNKEVLSSWRNLTKANLIKRKDSVNNLLVSLPPNVKALTDDEKEKLLTIRACYNDLLATWDYRSKKLVHQVNQNL